MLVGTIKDGCCGMGWAGVELGLRPQYGPGIEIKRFNAINTINTVPPLLKTPTGNHQPQWSSSHQLITPLTASPAGTFMQNQDAISEPRNRIPMESQKSKGSFFSLLKHVKHHAHAPAAPSGPSSTRTPHRQTARPSSPQKYHPTHISDFIEIPFHSLSALLMCSEGCVRARDVPFTGWEGEGKGD